MQELPKHDDHKAAQARCREIWGDGRFGCAEQLEAARVFMAKADTRLPAVAPV
jgi:hypothetical protein